MSQEDQERYRRQQAGFEQQRLSQGAANIGLRQQELAQGRRPSETEAGLNRLTELETGGQFKSYQDAPLDVKQRVFEKGQSMAVERQAPRTLPSSQIDDLRDTEKLVGQVGALEQGYKPEFTGPAHGRMAEWVSDPLGYTSDDEYQWATQVASLNNRYISKYMGANVPAQEFTRAKRVLINRTDTPAAVRQKLQVMKTELEGDAAATRKALQQAGYGGLPAARGAPQAPATHRYDPETGTVEAIR